jgi:hypothetical protein
MISVADITELIETYRKFDWQPRRLLLKTASRASLDDAVQGVPIVNSEIDAVWFSRAKQSGDTPWELRHIGKTPLALVGHIDEDSADFEKRLTELELRMAELLERQKPA